MAVLNRVLRIAGIRSSIFYHENLGSSRVLAHSLPGSRFYRCTSFFSPFVAPEDQHARLRTHAPGLHLTLYSALISCLSRIARTRSSIFYRKSLGSPRVLTRCLSGSRFYCCTLSFSPFTGPEIQHARLRNHASGLHLTLYSVLISCLGIGFVEAAYADSQKDIAMSPVPAEARFDNAALEETAKKERIRIQELLRNKGIKEGSYPQFTVGVKGSKVAIQFQVPPTCEAARLVANLVSKLGVKVEEPGAGSDMLMRSWDSAAGWQLALNPPAKEKDGIGPQEHSPDMSKHKEDLCIVVFRSLVSADKLEIAFFKQGSLSDVELEALVSVLQLAGMKLGGRDQGMGRRPKEGLAQVPSTEKTIADLEALGVRIYGQDASLVNPASKEGDIDWNSMGGSDQQNSKEDIAWNTIAGYDLQKREIEDTILMALRSPETYNEIARRTRHNFESNRPRAVLFEGPPGTGKTTSARFIANQAGVPLVYLPLEAIMSKWYGEGTRTLGKVFSLANKLPNGAIIFLDEIDSFAGSRDDPSMHEATRRILSVLLQQIDGFEQDKKVVIIAATNRRQDLDLALVSRFDTIIHFDLPDEQSRMKIVPQYAKHLKIAEVVEFVRATEGMSGRDIKEICQQAERSWASKIIRGHAAKDGEEGLVPPLQEYIEKAASRRGPLLDIAEQSRQRRR